MYIFSLDKDGAACQPDECGVERAVMRVMPAVLPADGHGTGRAGPATAIEPTRIYVADPVLEGEETREYPA